VNSTERLLIKHEGFRSKIYEDTRGIKTIGYGFNLEAGISEEEALLLLRHRIEKIRTRLSEDFEFFNRLSTARQDVLINMAYNLGYSGLLKFRKMLAAIAEEDWAKAKYELLDSAAARELHNRYNELARLLVIGAY